MMFADRGADLLGVTLNHNVKPEELYFSVKALQMLSSSFIDMPRVYFTNKQMELKGIQTTNNQLNYLITFN